MDWALIESWKEMGVPLHVALRGIESAFDSFNSKPRRRTVKSLLYCQEEVEAQFAEWHDAQVGGEAKKNGEQINEKGTEDAELPFSRAVILEHLERVRTSLLLISGERKRSGEDQFYEALSRSASRLAELEKDFAAAARPNAEKLEDSLTALEKLLEEALIASLPAHTRDGARVAAEEQLKPYRSRMERAVFDQTLDNLILKALREAQGLPRLSLFYI